MKRLLLALVLVALACTNENPNAPRLSKEPLSVRGWLSDVEGGQVRMAARVDKARPSGQFATIAGLRFPVIDTPIAQMADRHDYPTPPTTLVPIAKVR